MFLTDEYTGRYNNTVSVGITIPVGITLLYHKMLTRAAHPGHGGSVRDLTGDEEDMKDETMIPVDYAKAGQIKDDEILASVRIVFFYLDMGAGGGRGKYRFVCMQRRKKNEKKKVC